MYICMYVYVYVCTGMRPEDSALEDIGVIGVDGALGELVLYHWPGLLAAKARCLE